MNKRVLTIIIINLAIVMLAVFILIISSSNRDEKPDTSDVKYVGGMHDDVFRDDGYIEYREDIILENTSNNNLWGYIIADIKRERDFVKEEYVYAYDTDTGEKLLVFIPANSVVELRGIHFRATSISDEEAIRSDREPLTDVEFVEVEREVGSD